jgi:hypothetical protein
MKMDRTFGYYSKEKGEATIYDGRQRQEHTLSNGVKGFSIKTIFHGECTKNEFWKMINENESKYATR